MGSLTHAAPELLASRRNTPQSDVYAFGILVYEVITGREPFRGYSPADLIVLKTSGATADTLSLQPGSGPIFQAFDAVRIVLVPCSRVSRLTAWQS